MLSHCTDNLVSYLEVQYVRFGEIILKNRESKPLLLSLAQLAMKLVVKMLTLMPLAQDLWTAMGKG